MTDHRIPLLCLPHAGAGASFYWPWRKLLPEGLRPAPLQLPGREDRVEEEPWTDVHDAVEGLLADALDAIGDAPAVAVLGHSLGAVLAYELALALVQRHGVTVAELFVSGSPGPSASRTRRASGLGDDEFLARVEEFAGAHHPALEIPELREMILPTLRADVAMHENYRPSAVTPVPFPVTCLRGRSDELVSRQDALDWSAVAGAGFRFHELPGGHMYLTESVPQVVDLIADILGAEALPLR
ncbi:alpha/beta fold hydrolase [Streptomyces sp. NPDC052721]|uniref:thioesterase II family protein n=1 Tax=Streptomyces sp. NPDC052721 TaxID=3154955 RepID=UPI00343F7B6E